MPIMTFAEAVRKVRVAHGLTQSELSEGFGLMEGPSLIYQWETGRHQDRPSQSILRAMFEAEPTFARIAQEIWRLTT